MEQIVPGRQDSMMIDIKKPTIIARAPAALQYEIVYYTDPLCCWSWAFQKTWHLLKQEYDAVARIRYCMGGLIECWATYNDAEKNAISKPLQMGPLWMHAGHIAGVPMDSTIWAKDPPASSYLSCVAVKAAFKQSFQAGELYFFRLQEAVMAQGINIARQTALIKIAALIAKEVDFDVDIFRADLTNGEGYRAFNADIQEVRLRRINCFPTLQISCINGERGMLITGYEKYESTKKRIEAFMETNIKGDS